MFCFAYEAKQSKEEEQSKHVVVMLSVLLFAWLELNIKPSHKFRLWSFPVLSDILKIIMRSLNPVK